MELTQFTIISSGQSVSILVIVISECEIGASDEELIAGVGEIRGGSIHQCSTTRLQNNTITL